MPKSAKPNPPERLREFSPRAERALQSRQRILTTATRLFAKRGYDGVSVDEIVAQAKINKRMVYHYFESKSGLYTAVLESVFERLSSLEGEIFDDAPCPDIAIERIVSVYFDFLKKNPDFVSLLLWENLQGGKHLKELSTSVTKAPILEKLGPLIDEGVKNGTLRADIDKRYMLIDLIGICLIYFSNRHTLSRTVGLDLEDDAVLDQGLRHGIALVRHGFLNKG